MNYDESSILCFQHLKDEAQVFCFQVPDTCRFCHADLLNSELRIPPFRVPYPFKNSSKEYNSVVIKPTVGDFLNNYENSSDLHIGVTDSAGYVFEYDVNGFSRSRAEKWKECLSIKVIQSMTPSLQSYWDEILYESYFEKCWTPEMYDAEKHNCYSFVLSFLKSLGLKELQPYLLDKIIFCKHFVMPQAQIAAKYISLFRKLKNSTM